MTVHTVGSNGLTLFLDAEELSRVGRGLIDEPTALTLVRGALRDMGMSADPLEISAFVGKGGAMVVALLEDSEPGQWAFFRLPDADALLELMSLSARRRAACGQHRVFDLGGVYYIAVREQAGRKLPPAVSEFGSRVYKPQSFLTFLEEHGG
ncbi:MAG: hypothetical protein FWH06_07565 [Oscillospiraceae bacterium]|nr:hypothetical protein [Oscillospiraceae bacterium]